MLVIGGFLIFLSASLGLLARTGASFSDIATMQFLVGIVAGLLTMWGMSFVPYKIYKKYALFAFIGGVVATLLVFIPGIGLEINGARRWIDLGITTFQPVELLKIGYVLYLAVWLSGQGKKKNVGILEGILPFSIITGVVALILLLQPDTGSFLVIAAAGGAMFIASGARLRDILILGIAGILALSGVVMTRDYAFERIMTFINPSQDTQGAGWQITQSLYAVGSGQLFGRGYGQSIQKFEYLPEPISDSIFAVYAEEFGFLGSMLLIILFLVFALRGLWVSARAPDLYGGLVAVGIVIMIVAQSFLNIGAMLGVVPLTGLPLIFVSHGGSAMLMALASVGILLNISRHRRVG